MAEKTSFHEDLNRGTEVKAGSDRTFGLVFCAVFAFVGVWPLFGGGVLRWWALAIAMVFLLLAFLRPTLLAPLNRLWFRFGLLLHRIVSPFILGLLFFIAVTPVAHIMRVLGKSPLQLQFDHKADTYWIERTPPGPDPTTMPKQF
ncbi:MAG: hypothetical protein KIT00_03815 [Rhodospirillales bacterium]|nr:hypothetical protein [Rhodospirillales bacterium]